jgi:hypothetical protein
MTSVWIVQHKSDKEWGFCYCPPFSNEELAVFKQQSFESEYPKLKFRVREYIPKDEAQP